jgi:hypothetical protein
MSHAWHWRRFALDCAAMPSARLAAAVCLLGLACNGPGDSSTGFTTPGVTTRPDDTGDSTSTSGSASSTSSTSSSTGSGSADGSTGSSSTTAAAFPDMGMMPDFGGPPMGCKGKIDFLFVISRSGVMGPAQDQLVAAAPAFISTIQAQFDDFDVHIMVVDSVEEWWVEDCEDMACGTCDIDPNYPCGYKPSVCDETIGAGTVFNAGPNTMDVPCELGERRYITKDTPDMKGAFECIARVGTWGNNAMADALVAAVSPQLNASEPEPGGCNAGFLRDDALLVLTMIGPEDAPGVGSSQGKWQEWRQAVVDAKHGDLNAIVALGIISGPDCKPDTDPNMRLCNLIPSFPNSVLEHLTLEDFGDAFDEAAVLALDACSSFVPG